jgi:hypothetical protein
LWRDTSLLLFGRSPRGKSALTHCDHSPRHRKLPDRTIVGYAIALLISIYILWIFERTGGMSPEQVIPATIVLGFPAALGAGAARLIL